jgi:two-component system LytT family response regulator
MKVKEFEVKTFTCIIIDSDLNATNKLKLLLSDHKQLEIVSIINDAELALDSIIRFKPDLLFLDIQMPGKDGFQILETLKCTDIRPFVILVTDSNKYAIQAVRTAVFDYLLKPVESCELAISVERFLSKYRQQKLENSYNSLLNQTTKKKLKFNTASGFTLIDPLDIIYVKADWNYSEIYLGKDKMEVITMNIGCIELLLPKCEFVRINRSTIININYLDKVQRLKRKCLLKKDEVTYEFNIPVLRIRFLESFIEEVRSQ